LDWAEWAEMLARAGIGSLVLIDRDVISHSNLNRQILALTHTVGKPKTSLMAERVMAINPDCEVVEKFAFITAETDLSFLKECDFVVDAIDTVSAKLWIAQYCFENQIPIIAAMGCGNRLDPSALFVGDLFETSGCPLGRVMRRELRCRHVTSLTVVASKEPPLKPLPANEPLDNRRQTPGSVPFVPSAAGILLSHHVVTTLLQKHAEACKLKGES
jgi:tRNA A37 threonylcarbamoyladenosine dehydratase